LWNLGIGIIGIRHMVGLLGVLAITGITGILGTNIVGGRAENTCKTFCVRWNIDISASSGLPRHINSQ
jgi:hypothetical protein